MTIRVSACRALAVPAVLLALAGCVTTTGDPATEPRPAATGVGGEAVAVATAEDGRLQRRGRGGLRRAEPPLTGLLPAINIRDDRGGNVMAAVARRDELERTGRVIAIRGYCRSACTIYTTMTHACLGPGAVIGFHAPRLPNTTIIPPLVGDIMGRYYRNGILQRWNNGWSRSIEMHRISAKEYVRLDPQAKLCPE